MGVGFPTGLQIPAPPLSVPSLRPGGSAAGGSERAPHSRWARWTPGAPGLQAQGGTGRISADIQPADPGKASLSFMPESDLIDQCPYQLL